MTTAASLFDSPVASSPVPQAIPPVTTRVARLPDLVIVLESHGDSAMLYLSGRLGHLAAVHAASACEDIPRSVRSLRVDLRRVQVVSEGALETFALVLGAWRTRRHVHMRLDLPPLRATA